MRSDPRTPGIGHPPPAWPDTPRWARRGRPRLRACSVLAWLCLALAIPGASAQDTPEMLAAMRAAMPPVPAQVREFDALPLELRRQIPALRIEVHRWHADPGQRFVRIGGRRVLEDGVAGQELWLRQIRKDAVVMQFRGEFFLLPISTGR